MGTLGGLTGARSLWTLVVAAERAGDIRTVLQAQPVEHVTAEDRDREAVAIGLGCATLLGEIAIVCYRQVAAAMCWLETNWAV